MQLISIPMKKSLLLFLTISCISYLAHSQTTIAEGDVSGTWNLAGSPYQVHGEIHIPSGQTLSIEAGVRILFQGHHRFFVYGTLMAMGTVTDSIYFTVENDTTEWCGIEFSNPVQNSSRSLLEYCVIEHSYAYSGLSEPYTSNYDVGGGIMAEYGNLTIRNCAIRNNKALLGAGIKCRLNTVIENTAFTNNTALGKDIIYIEDGASISGCLISDNKASENIVRILQYVLFLNNTISGNMLDSTGVAIAMIHGYPDLVNSVFFGNSLSSFYLSGGSNPRFYNCDIEGGKNSIYAEGSDNNGEFVGIYDNNIESFPVFVDTSQNNYQLEESSPCIDAGSHIDWNPNLVTDILGNPRCDTITNKVDIGAYEFQADIEIPDTISSDKPKEFLADLRIYPNPVSDLLSIESNSDILEFSIRDIQGKIIMQGKYTEQIQVGDLPDGYYILLVRSDTGFARKLFLKYR